MLSNNRIYYKKYITKLPRHSAALPVIKLLSCLILMRIFENSPNELHSNAEISKIKKCTQRDLHFLFNALLNHFNILVKKHSVYEIGNVVTYRKICATIWDFRKVLVTIIWYS